MGRGQPRFDGDRLRFYLFETGAGAGMWASLCVERRYLQFILVNHSFINCFGGESGIRTHDTLARIPVFETGPFNRSGISPCARAILPARTQTA